MSRSNSRIQRRHSLTLPNTGFTPTCLRIRKPPQIDRQTTTPFLFKFCYNAGGFHNLSDFPVTSPSNPNPRLPSHLQIYTWPSRTLRELAHTRERTPKHFPRSGGRNATELQIGVPRHDATTWRRPTRRCAKAVHE